MGDFFTRMSQCRGNLKNCFFLFIPSSLPPGENWVVFSVSGDAFLRGQVRKLVGLALSITRGWLPEWYLDLAIQNHDSIVDIPSVPKEGLSMAECR